MLQLRVEAIKWETPDTATFYFSETTGKSISYRAGQFITLVFTHHQEEIRRSYSLSSSPGEPLLSITAKRIANGEISRFMLTKIKVGDIINAVEPAGKFIVPENSPQDIFFFAGGSGITPIFSQIKHLIYKGSANKLILIYSSQNAREVLFKAELDKLQAENSDHFEIIYLFSSEGNRLNNEMAEELVKESSTHIGDALFYLCGPFAYMRMIRLTLLYMGVNPENIRRENFVLETVNVPHATLNYPARSIRIHFKNETHDITVGENQTILQAALQNDIQLPYSCRAGICSACAAHCKSGKIDMPVNDVLTDNDLRQGWILTCTGYPVTDDVEIAFL